MALCFFKQVLIPIRKVALHGYGELNFVVEVKQPEQSCDSAQNHYYKQRHIVQSEPADVPLVNHSIIIPLQYALSVDFCCPVFDSGLKLWEDSTNDETFDGKWHAYTLYSVCDAYSVNMVCDSSVRTIPSHILCSSTLLLNMMPSEPEKDQLKIETFCQLRCYRYIGVFRNFVNLSAAYTVRCFVIFISSEQSWHNTYMLYCSPGNLICCIYTSNCHFNCSLTVRVHCQTYER